MSDDDLLALLKPRFELPTETFSGVDQAERNTDEWWAACAEVGIRYLAGLAEPFGADEVRALGVPEPDEPNRWGAAFRRAARDGLIKQVGARPSTTGSRRGGLVRVWIGTAA